MIHPCLWAYVHNAGGSNREIERFVRRRAGEVPRRRRHRGVDSGPEATVTPLTAARRARGGSAAPACGGVSMSGVPGWMRPIG